MAVTSKVTKNEQALLEDDDDFEEFPTEGRLSSRVVIYEESDVTIDWTAADEDAEDTQMWEDNWDDDNVEDDFSTQLRCVIITIILVHTSIKVVLQDTQVSLW